MDHNQIAVRTVVFISAVLPHSRHDVAFINSRVSAAPWKRRVIDDSARGADGVRLADCNADRRPDITTGWEEGGITRVLTCEKRENLGVIWY